MTTIKVNDTGRFAFDGIEVKGTVVITSEAGFTLMIEDQECIFVEWRDFEYYLDDRSDAAVFPLALPQKYNA